MNITIIGTGFVGVVSAAVYASLGHQVIGLDVDDKKIAKLKKSQVPFFEPDLEELLKSQQKAGRLNFTTDYHQAISHSEVIIIAVGTPSAPDGQADLKFVFMSAQSLAPHLQDGAIVVVKSTVPPGTLPKVEAIIKQHSKRQFYTAALPEFLREGSAVQDTKHPDRIAIGATNQAVFEKLELLHQPFNAPIIKVKPESAQMAKYSANAYLATRITFINQIADLCEKNGADIQEVVEIIGLDKRIGSHYWYPGLGYGGSCFPKDVKELAAYSRSINEGDNLLNKVADLNENRLSKLMNLYEQKINGFAGKVVAVLGLSFKPNTDDRREAPSVKIIPLLKEKGAIIQAFDPMAKLDEQDNTLQKATLTEACHQADVIMLLVEWPEIITFDYSQVRQPGKPQWLIDARNQLNPSLVKKWGFHYIGTGRN